MSSVLESPLSAPRAPSSGRLRERVQRLFEPSLQGRTAASVLVAFVVVFGVLLVYAYSEARQTLDNPASGLRLYTEALVRSLDAVPEPERAREALAVTIDWTGVRRQQVGRLPGVILYELHSADGRQVYRSPGLGDTVLQDGAPGMREVHVRGVSHRVYLARSEKWTLWVVEPWRTAGQILYYNVHFLPPYLLVALPFVLLPVWMSVRNGLKPLQQLASHIAQRDPANLQPLALPVNHRELKPLSHALDALLAKLREQIQRERRFVQEAAHELRTPLAVVTAQAHVLARSQDEQERGAAHGHLNHAIDRASHLARQLLVLASLEDAQQRPARHIDVAQAVRQLLAQAAPAALERGTELSLEAPDELHGVLDEAAFESIVFNLVDNALRYGRPSSGDGSVVVSLRDDGEHFVLLVQDDGPGIPAAERERVFERFHRGAGHDQPGSGLGLAIVRQAAARMQGRVYIVEGIGGAGVGFRVELPVPGFMPG